MADRLDELLSEDREISGRGRKLLALLLLGFAASIAIFGRFEGQTWYFMTKTFSIAPTFLSGIFGFGLLIPLYLRSILRFRFTVYGLVSFVIMALVFSSFAQIAIGDGFGQTLKTYLLAAALLLSWLGMRGVAGFAWILVVAAVFLTMQSTSNAMGLWGWSFLAASITGLILHANMGPASLLRSIGQEYGTHDPTTARDVTPNDAGLESQKQKIDRTDNE